MCRLGWSCNLCCHVATWFVICLASAVFVDRFGCTLALYLSLSLSLSRCIHAHGCAGLERGPTMRVDSFVFLVYTYIFIYSAHVMFRVVYVSSLCVRACVRIVSMYTYMHPYMYIYIYTERERGWGEQGDGTMERDRWVDKERERKS